MTTPQKLLPIKYKGVYKSGEKWKAQLQHGGSQYYLGTYDSPEAAARAYDQKVRDCIGCKSATNFDENGQLSESCLLKESSMPFLLRYTAESTQPTQLLSSYSTQSEWTNTSAAVLQLPSIANLTSNPPMYFSTAASLPSDSAAITGAGSERAVVHSEMSGSLADIWDLLCLCNKQIVVAKAAKEKLGELSFGLSDSTNNSSILSSTGGDDSVTVDNDANENVQDGQRIALLTSLTDEIHKLSTWKMQLEAKFAEVILLRKRADQEILIKNKAMNPLSYIGADGRPVSDHLDDAMIAKAQSTLNYRRLAATGVINDADAELYSSMSQGSATNTVRSNEYEKNWYVHSSISSQSQLSHAGSQLGGLMNSPATGYIQHRSNPSSEKKSDRQKRQYVSNSAVKKQRVDLQQQSSARSYANTEPANYYSNEGVTDSLLDHVNDWGHDASLLQTPVNMSSASYYEGSDSNLGTSGTFLFSPMGNGKSYF